MFTCSSAESNPAASITWFVSLDYKKERLDGTKIESMIESSGHGWTTVSRAAVTAPAALSFKLFCVAEVSCLGFSRESSQLAVDVLSKKLRQIYKNIDLFFLGLPGHISIISPQFVVKDKEATINCSAEGY